MRTDMYLVIIAPIRAAPAKCHRVCNGTERSQIGQGSRVSPRLRSHGGRSRRHTQEAKGGMKNEENEEPYPQKELWIIHFN